MRQISSYSATVFDLSSHLPMGHHFRDAVAAIRQPFVVYDAEERLAAFNAAFSDLHREPDGTRVLHPGMSFQDVMEWRLRTGFFAPDPEGAGHLPAAEYRLARGDVVYRLRDGRWMFVDNYSLPDGRLACTWSDITAVKQAERQLWELSESLRQSQDHLVRAQRIAQVGSIERDLRTDNLRWTAEMYQIFGRDPRLPPPTRAENLKLFHPDDRARFAEELRASEEGRTTAPAEFRIVRPDGSIRWIHHESEVFYDDAGKPSLRIATYKDVTEIHEYREQSGPYKMSQATGVAVLVDGLTTVVGFGSLMIANHRGLQSLGRVLTLGVSCCMFTSMIMLPALLTWMSRNRRGAEDEEGPATRSRPRKSVVRRIDEAEHPGTGPHVAPKASYSGSGFPLVSGANQINTSPSR